LQAGATLSGITVATNVVTFPAGVPGNYKLDFNGTAATSWAINAWASTTGTLINLAVSDAARDAQSVIISQASTGATQDVYSGIFVTVPQAGCTVTISPGVIVGTAAADLWIYSIPSSVLTLVEEEKELRDEVAELREQLLEMREAMRGKSLQWPTDGSMAASVQPAIQRSVSPFESGESDSESAVILSKAGRAVWKAQQRK